MEVLNRLQLVTLPQNLSPQLSPWSPIGEIYRYRLMGSGYSLNELKATEDWFVEREIKQVSGIVDVTSFGGSTPVHRGNEFLQAAAIQRHTSAGGRCRRRK